MKRRSEAGQAILLLVIGMGLFLLAAAGLAVDGTHLYAQRQMAQAAADAAAEAGILTLFGGTAGASGTGFTNATFTCTTTDTRTPCRYAAMNGFNTAADTVTVDFPATSSYPNVNFASGSSTPVQLIRVTVARSVSTTLLRFMGPTAQSVRAAGVAAIVEENSPVPIIVTHPNLSGALASNGNPTITICGGYTRSIQVNSSSATSITMNSNTTVDLSKAGPLDDGTCSTGTGADFGDFGGPSTTAFTFLKGTLPGKYIQPALPITDPFADVNPPSVPAASPTAGTTASNGGTKLTTDFHGCTPAPGKDCMEYAPGAYANGLFIKNQTAVFKPGVYYIQANGFKNQSNGIMMMGTGYTNDAVTQDGMLVYNDSNATFDVGSNSSAALKGTPKTSIYKTLLFFNKRSAAANTGIGSSDQHRFGGGGAMSLTGSIYIHDTNALAIGGTYQHVLLQGTPGSSTLIQGLIVVNTLELGGNAAVKMNLDPTNTLIVRKVALIN